MQRAASSTDWSAFEATPNNRPFFCSEPHRSNVIYIKADDRIDIEREKIGGTFDIMGTKT